MGFHIFMRSFCICVRPMYSTHQEVIAGASERKLFPTIAINQDPMTGPAIQALLDGPAGRSSTTT